MKTTTSMTIVYLLILSAMVGGLLLTPTATASTIQATIVIDPEKFNLSEPPESWKSPVVIVEIKFPKEYRDRIQDIDNSTVLLDGAIPIDPEYRVIMDPRKCKIFFDKQVVINHLWLKMAHMGYNEPFKNVELELTVTGNLNDATPFEGSDTVLVSAK